MISRAVVLQPAFLGDVVFAAPLTRAIAEGWPDCELTFVARPPADEIARHLPGVSRVVVYDKRGAAKGWSGLQRVSQQLRALKPELVIALHDSPRTALLARLSGAPVRLGPGGGFGATLYTQTEPLDDLAYVDRSCALAAALGLAVRPELELGLPDDVRNAGRRAVSSECAVALIPGSEWETKRWPVEKAAALARQLRDGGWSVVLLGSPAERDLCAEVNVLSRGACLDLCGNRVEEALGVLSACCAAVGGDSGLTHAARALGVATVSLFGPTSPGRHRAVARDRFVTQALACSPCSEHGGRRCPLGHHRCLGELGVERVAAALAELA